MPELRSERLMQVERGFRDKLNNHVNLSQPFTVEMSVSGSAKYDYLCFCVDENDKLADKRYMIFHKQTHSPNNEIAYSLHRSAANFDVNLERLPASVNKLIFTVNVSGTGTMSGISSHKVSIIQGNLSVLNMLLRGNNFHNERAIISLELYRKKDTWRIGVIAAGFIGGLREILKHYSETELLEAPNITAKPKTIELRKGEKVNLDKASGEILINLNWHKNVGGAIDLDLGCLYELKDGSKGSVQALGRHFGSLGSPPYVALDGDDRTGETEGGENLRVNSSKIAGIRKILVYTFIYEGATNWKEADGVVTVRCPGSRDIIVRMDEYDTTEGMCAIAMLENVNDMTLSVEKLVKFFGGHEEMDRYYHWGLKWIPASK